MNEATSFKSLPLEPVLSFRLGGLFLVPTTMYFKPITSAYLKVLGFEENLKSLGQRIFVS